MSPLSKKEYFKTIKARYKKSSSRIKSVILDEFCANCGYNRKYAIRKLNKPRLRNPRSLIYNKPGPRSKYDIPEIKRPLEEIWRTANLPCSKRLKAIIPLWIPFYQLEFGILKPEVIRVLNKISPATIDRVMRLVRIRFRGKGRCATKPGLLLKSHIPIKTDQWDEKRPGFIEADTVAHCGTSLEGIFVWTIDCVDIATGWTEQRAMFGKSNVEMAKQLKDIENTLPFEILGFDSDNGSEFINRLILEHFLNRKKPVQYTRSRAYKKDDNAHVEGKNWTHVRQWLGYRRFENPKITDLLNELYKSQWRLFLNFFMPSVKLVQKKRIGSKIIKIHDSPKTPYQRVLDSKHVASDIKEQLQKEIKTLNPFKLRKTINEKIVRIHKLAR